MSWGCHQTLKAYLLKFNLINEYSLKKLKISVFSGRITWFL